MYLYYLIGWKLDACQEMMNQQLIEEKSDTQKRMAWVAMISMCVFEVWSVDHDLPSIVQIHVTCLFAHV